MRPHAFRWGASPPPSRQAGLRRLARTLGGLSGGSLERPKNLSGALKNGAQSEVALRPCSVTVELGLVSVWGVGVPRPQGRCDKRFGEER